MQVVSRKSQVEDHLQNLPGVQALSSSEASRLETSHRLLEFFQPTDASGLLFISRPVKMKELYSILVYLTLLILPNTRRTSGSNVEETSERYKIEGKITIQGFKPSGKNVVYDSADSV